MGNFIKRYLPRFAIAALAVFLAAFSALGAPGGREIRNMAGRVIDGDTIHLKGGEKVRYLGIDSPERGEPFYEEAKRRNAELVRGRMLRLVVCAREPRDKYGRTLAWVYADDSTLVNAVLLREGLAKLMIIAPCGLEKENEFRAIEKEAQSEHRGIWGRANATSNTDAPLIAAGDALRHAGEAVRVRGRVRDVHRSRSAIYINFGNRRTGFTAVIFKGSFDAFSAASVEPRDFIGRLVTVTGVIKRYGERAEIIVKLPTQIEMN